MTKKRRLKTKKKSEWVGNLLKTGQGPQKGEPGYSDYLSWKYFDSEVEDLPPAREFNRSKRAVPGFFKEIAEPIKKRN